MTSLKMAFDQSYCILREEDQGRCGSRSSRLSHSSISLNVSFHFIIPISNFNLQLHLIIHTGRTTGRVFVDGKHEDATSLVLIQVNVGI